MEKQEALERVREVIEVLESAMNDRAGAYLEELSTGAPLSPRLFAFFAEGAAWMWKLREVKRIEDEICAKVFEADFVELLERVDKITKEGDPHKGERNDDLSEFVAVTVATQLREFDDALSAISYVAEPGVEVGEADYKRFALASAAERLHLIKQVKTLRKEQARSMFMEKEVHGLRMWWLGVTKR